jgi:hypothetical protein
MMGVGGWIGCERICRSESLGVRGKITLPASNILARVQKMGILPAGLCTVWTIQRRPLLVGLRSVAERNSCFGWNGA